MTPLDETCMLVFALHEHLVLVQRMTPLDETCMLVFALHEHLVLVQRMTPLDVHVCGI